jgi:SLOG cluster2
VADDLPQTLPEPAPGFTVGVSVSDSPDLARLGLTETHLRMTLGEVARATLIAKGRLSYGGHLREDGYTAFLVHECEKYGSRNRPFTGHVPWSVHRRLAVDDINRHSRAIGLYGTYVFLDRDGQPIEDPTADRDLVAMPVGEQEAADSLTAARRHLTATCDARLVVGGQRTGYQGKMPGVIEETIFAIRAGQPVFVAGGYGGAAGDIVRVLGLDPDNWLDLADETSKPYIRELAIALDESGRPAEANGLTLEHNQQLAISYRASEIASLVIHGLTRLRSR